MGLPVVVPPPMAMDLEASNFQSQMKLTLGCITIISTEVGHSLGGSGIAKHLTTVISLLYIASLKHTRQKHRMITMYISIGSMYAIYGNIYYQYTPHVSIIAYVYVYIYTYIPYMDPIGYLYIYIYIYVYIYIYQFIAKLCSIKSVLKRIHPGNQSVSPVKIQ